VTWVSVVLNVVLTAAQVIVGIVGHSQALVADGMHTLSDLITDAIVLVALPHSAKDADDEHPYGHGRIETAVTLGLGVLLILVAAGIAFPAGARLLDPAPFVVPAPLAFWVAVVTLGAKEWLYRYTLRTATRFDSAMLRANAWHHRSDAVSSLIVIVGIGGALYGFGYLDAIAAILVSVMVAKVGVELAWNAVRELIDTALDTDERAAITRVIQGVGGVKAMSLLRTRRVGNRALVDVHIQVDREVSASEGHQIGEVVRARLIEQVAPVSDVLVHIDTEPCRAVESDPRLPLRDEIARRLESYFADIPQAQLIDRMLLHYVQGRVDVELRLPLTAVATAAEGRQLADRLVAAAGADKDIGKVEVHFH
jgi:cation diffusion facilitator family transporter